MGRKTTAVVAAIVLAASVVTIPQAFAASPGAATVRLLVQAKRGLNSSQQQALVARHGGKSERTIASLGLTVVQVAAGKAASLQRDYASDPSVARVEVDHSRKIASAASDPDYSNQWALPKIGWDQVHGTVVPSGNATLAVVDTGVAGDNADLSGLLVPGWSAFGTDPATDPNGHGTAVASIAAAATDNANGIAGVAYANTRIMPVQAIGSDGTGQDSDIVAGITWAADNGADVILLAFSNSTFSQALQDAVSYAWSKGAVVVAATGNAGSDVTTYPAGDADVVGVAATDSTDALWAGSGYGADTLLAAPGVDIAMDSTTGGTGTVSGTSAAAAIVAGSAALLRANDSSASNAVVVGRLARNADPAGTQSQTGNGRINLARAIADASTTALTPAGAADSGGPFVGPYTVANIAVSATFDATTSSITATPADPNPGQVNTNKYYQYQYVSPAPSTTYYSACKLGAAASSDTFALPAGFSTGSWSIGLARYNNAADCTGKTNKEATSSITVTITVSVSGAVLSGDGTVNGGSAVPGATVALTRISPTPQTLIATVQSSSTGAYSFASLAPGTYRLDRTNPTGWVSTNAFAGNGATKITNDQISVVLAAGTPSSSNNFIAQQRSDLALAKTGPSAATIGSSAGFDYTLSVTNNGPADQPTGAVTVSDTLPAGVTFQATGSDAGCSAVGQVVTCSNSATLSSATSTSFTVHVVVGSGVASGTVLSNTATVSSTIFDPTTANNTSNTVSTTATAQSSTTAAANKTALYGDSSVTLTATVTAGSAVNAGAVTFTVVDSGNNTVGSAVSGNVTSGAASAVFTIPSGTAVGTYSINASYGGGGPFGASSDNTKTLVINKASSATVVSCPSGAQTYTGAAQTPCSVSVTGAGGLSLAPDASYSDNTNAGLASAGYTYSGDGNHTGSSDSKTFTIGQAPLTVDANPAGKAFGASDPDLSYTLHGFVGGTDDAGNSGITGAGSCSRTAGETVLGSPYTITCGAGNLLAPNYSFATGSTANFTISQASSTTVVTCPTSTPYTGSAVTPCSVLVTGPGGLRLTPTPTYVGNLNAGTGTASASYMYAGDANYAGSSDSKSFSISKASSTTVVICPTTPQTYTGAAQEPCSVSVTGVGGLSLAPDASYSDNTNVGQASAGYSYVGDDNHTGSSDSQTFTIGKAPLTVDADAAGKTYGDGDPTLTYTLHGFVGSDDAGNSGISGAGSCSRTSGETVPNSPYTITCGPGTLLAPNYSFATGSTANFTIDPASSTTVVTCPSAAQTYTGAAQEPCSVSVTGAGGLSLKPNPTYANNINAGINSASASYTYAGDDNHAGSKDSATFTISQARLTVDADAGSKTFGSGDPSLSYTLHGFVGSDDATNSGVTGAGSCSRTAGETVLGSTYMITCVPDSLSAPNYSFATGSTAPFTINKASSSTVVRCPSTPQTYTGSAQEPCSVSVTGAGGLSLSPSPTYANNTNAGVNSASASYNYSGDDNHTGSLDNQTFTIGKAPLTVDANAGSKTYGASDPGLSYTLHGFVGGTDDSTNSGITGAGSCSRTSGETVVGSPYTITCVPDGLSAPNYSFATGSTANFAIYQAATSTVVTCPVSRTYTGSPLRPCSVSVTGPAGLSLTPTPTYANNTNAGIGTASASYAYAGDANYLGSSDIKSFTIDKAGSTTSVSCPTLPQTYTAAAQTPCTVSVTGAGGLSLTPNLSYSGNLNVGNATASYSYGGDDNHTGSSDSKHFSISQARLTVDANAGSKIFGSSDPALTYTLHGFLGSDDATTSGIGGAGSCTRTSGESVGGSPYTITCVPNTLTSLNYAFVTGSTATFSIGALATTTTLAISNPTVQYSDQQTLTATVAPTLRGGSQLTGNVTFSIAGEPAIAAVPINSSGVATVTVNLSGGVSQPNPSISKAVTATFVSTNNNFTGSGDSGSFTETRESAQITYTGDTLDMTSSTGGSTTVQLAAVVNEQADSWLGSQLGSTTVTFGLFNSTNASNTPNATCTTSLLSVVTAGAGTGSCSISVAADNYAVKISLNPNPYYEAPVEDAALTVAVPGTGFSTGGGSVLDQTLGTKSNFGFTAKFLKNSNVQGNSLYIYRMSVAANSVANPAGGWLLAGDYNWIIKSNSMTALTQACSKTTPVVCTATFTGKSTITAVSRATGIAYSLGGNNQFQVDVTDRGEPGAKSSPAPDSYAIRVWNSSGTYYQLGSPTAQIALNGGNIQVHP